MKNNVTPIEAINYRKKNEMSQKEMAKHCGISIRTYSRFESNKRIGAISLLKIWGGIKQ